MVHLARSSKEETAPSRRNHVFVGLVDVYKVLGPRYKYQTTSTWVPGTENTVASSENVACDGLGLSFPLSFQSQSVGTTFSRTMWG